MWLEPLLIAAGILAFLLPCAVTWRKSIPGFITETVKTLRGRGK